MENGTVKDLMVLSEEKIDLIRKTVAKDANDLELQMFLHLCGQYQLDPFLKEIYFMKRKVWNAYKNGYDEVPTMMVSRDGFLSIAHKSGQFGGMKTVCLVSPTGTLSMQESEITPQGFNLVGAKCTVWNKSFPYPVEQSVSFNEYCVFTKDGKRQGLWNTKPETMIKKVAEAQALRKAFNVHGVYLQEEMESEIARDSMREMDNISDTLKLAEKVHGEPQDYSSWAQDAMTNFLNDLEAVKDEQSHRDLMKNYTLTINNLTAIDRKYIMEEAEHAFQRIVRGDYLEPAVEAPEAVKEPKVAQKTRKTAPQSHDVKAGGAETPTPDTHDHAEEAEREKAGKDWLPTAISGIKECTTKAQLAVWQEKNRDKLKSLIPIHRDYLEAFIKSQEYKVKEGESCLGQSTNS